MYVLIYDDHDLGKPRKQVLSVHKTRHTAENALVKRRKRLKRRVWECNTRVVWVPRKVKTGEFITYRDFSTWAPGEAIPHGELHSDTD